MQFVSQLNNKGKIKLFEQVFHKFYRYLGILKLLRRYGRHFMVHR
jgi:hypothetical protein